VSTTTAVSCGRNSGDPERGAENAVDAEHVVKEAGSEEFSRKKMVKALS